MTSTSVIDAGSHPLVSGCPPEWASGWGQDRFGVFVEFTIENVIQRMRWIVPGRFLMGSPDDEPGRLDWEGPRHAVTIGQGFWLFDTPCTQGLWEAVMGSNPSRFQSPARPVERVSWNEVQEFVSAINRVKEGLGLGLPSEAQWEYACRAGSKTAIYTGDVRILGENNAPELDPIAWYAGNSGVEFELQEGEESSGWSEKQYQHERAGTHPVGLKQANGWGLYDMLGNVWEWTQDQWHDSYNGAPADGSPWEDEESGAPRVFRGGSWHNFARPVRAACRNRWAPVIRHDFVGFRCARVQG